MKVGELRLILDQLRQLYASAGASGPGKDLKALIDVLDLRAGESVDTFVADIKLRLRAGPSKKAQRSGKAGGTAAPLNEGAIGSYVAQLNAAGTDRQVFDAVFAKMTADKALRLAELTEIAHRYSGGVAKHKSVASAHDGISKAFVRQARFINKLS